MTLHNDDIQRFTNWLLSDVMNMTQSLGYTPTRFINMVKEHDGVKACKLLLRPEVPASIGFYRLHKLNRLDLSVEHIALSEEWSHLFDDRERETAQFRLDNADELCDGTDLIGE